MKIRLEIEEVFLQGLKNKLNEQDTVKVIQDALTLLNWMVNEIQQNRIILSTDQDGEEVKQLNMQSLEKIRKNILI